MSARGCAGPSGPPGDGNEVDDEGDKMLSSASSDHLPLSLSSGERSSDTPAEKQAEN